MTTHKSHVPERAKKTNSLINKIQTTLANYGYSEIFLPLYEYYEILKYTTWDFRDENIIRFIDRNSGKSMVLRPDFTPQVCRMVSTYMRNYPTPLRLQYKGRVFRNVNLDKGLKSEKYQVGFENFGSSELYGDLELLSIASATMKELGVSDYKIVIGDQHFIQLLTTIASESEEYIKLLTEKNLDKIKHFTKEANFSKELSLLLNYLPLAFGGCDILDELYSKCMFDKNLSERVSYLKKIYSLAQEVESLRNSIIFDIGETKGAGYYTGMNIDIINYTTGSVLGSGGRYDSLMNNFGQNMTACGLAYNIEEILPLYRYDSNAELYDYLIVGRDNFFKAEKLRNEGNKVFWTENDNNIVQLKNRYRFKNIIM
jgi:ATP phosphoribosyltransferase regulatory subunit